MPVAELPSPEQILKDLYPDDLPSPEKIMQDLYPDDATGIPSPDKILKDLYDSPAQEPELTLPNTGRMSLDRFKKRGELSEERAQSELARQNLPTDPNIDPYQAALDTMHPNALNLLPQGVKDAALLGVASGVGDAISQVGGALNAAGAAGQAISTGKPKWQDYLVTGAIGGIPGVGGVMRKVGGALSESGKKLSAKYNPEEIGNPGGAVTEFVHGATSSGVASVPAMAAGWAGGLPTAIGAGSLQSFGSAFNDAKRTYLEQGIPEPEAEQQALVPALGEGLATAVVMTLFGKRGSMRFLRLKDTPHPVDLTVRSAIKEVLHGGIEEGVEEATEQAIQSYVAFKTYRPDMTLEDAVMASIQAGVYGAAIGGVINAGVSGTRLTIQKMGETTPPPEISRLDPEVQRLVQEGSARTEATPPPIPAEPVKPPTEEQFNQTIQEQNQQRAKVNEKDVLAIAGNELASLEQQTDLTPAQDQRRGLLRLFLEKPTTGTARTLAVMFDLQLDPEATEFPAKYKPKGGEVSAETKTSPKEETPKGVEPTPVRVQEVIPVPAVQPQPVSASGTFGIRFTPAVKALSKVVESLNPSLKTASIGKIQVNNAQAESLVAPEPGVLKVNPAKLFEETKGMTEGARAKHIEGLVKAETDQYTDPDGGPKYAVPSTQEGQTSVEEGKRQLSSVLSVTALPAKISVIHDPNLPWSGFFEGGQVIINMAKTNDPVATLLEEGLHGIIEAIKKGEIVDAQLKEALEAFAAAVTKADTETERARRQGLDLRDRVIAEEALVAKVLETSPSLLTRVLNAIRSAFKRIGIDLPADQRTRILDAAKAWLVNEKTGQTGERRFSYARTATEAREQMAVVKTTEDQHVQAHHNLAQAFDLDKLLDNNGAPALTPRSAEMLGVGDIKGTANVGTQNNKGQAYGYRQSKLVSTRGERAMLARIAHSSLLKFRDVTERLTETRDKLAKKIASSGTVRLQLSEAIARAKKNATELALKVSGSVFSSAYEMAVRTLKYEAKTDRRIAELEGEMKGISDASKSPQAIRQLLEGMVKALASTPQGILMLYSTNGVQPGVSASDIVSAYKQATRAAGLPLHEESLMRWAALILTKSRDVREKLLAQELAAQSPIRILMNQYQKDVLDDLEKNPVGTVKRALRDRQRMTTAKERAIFAWHKLNSELTERMEKFQELDDAVTVGQAVVNDPAFISLLRETGDDVERSGGKRTLLFRSKTFLTPSGLEVNIDPEIMIGAKTLWAQTRATLETAQQELQLWLQLNLGHEDYGEHQRNLELLTTYYLGLGQLQPNDTMGTVKAVKKTFDILWNAVERGGGRVAAALKRVVAEFEDTKLKANWWNQRWTGLLTEGARKAFLSHDETKTWGSYGQKSLTDVNNEWWVKVGSQLAYSHNRQADPLQVGDRLGSGWEVTQADLDYLYLQADAASAGFALLKDQQTKDTLAGVIYYRKGLKGGRGTVPRMFNQDLRDQFARPFSEAYRAMQLALRNGNNAAANAASQKMMDLANQFFLVIGFSMVWDRNTDFSKATPLDGPGGAFDLVSQAMSQGAPISNLQELVIALEQNSMLSANECLNEVINEWGRMVDNWYQAAKVEDSPEAPRAEETKNSFTRPRLDALAPYAFYQYGFKTGHSVATFAAGIYSESLDKVAAGLKALITDLRRQQSERSTKIKAGRNQSHVDNENALARDAADTYDSYKDLDLRIRYAEDIYALLVNDRSDTDVDIQLARHIAALTGALISGTTTTLRNITTGPLYLGQFTRKLSGSNLYGYGMGMAYSWIDAQARILYALGLSVTKGVVWDLPTGTFKALWQAASTTEGRRPTRFINTAMRGFIHEIGDRSYDRIKGVREMKARGIHFIPNQLVDFDNRLLGSTISQGRLVEEDPTGLKKLGFVPISIYESVIAPIYKALAPTFGDTALNLANYNLMMSSMGPVHQLDQRLRRLFMDFQDMGLTVDDLKDRLYTHSQIFPRFKGLRVSSSANDMKNVRQAFDLAGMNFDEKVNEFLGQLFGGNPTAQFLTDVERDQLANAAINYSNRATGANNPLNLNKKTFLNNLISPFMFWKARQLSNFMNEMSVPVVSGRGATTMAELHQKRVVAWVFMMATILIPSLLAGIAVSSGDEWEARQVKKLLYNQVNATRYFWERDTTKSKWIGAFVASMNGIPFIDMAMNAAFNDMPNRASLDPSLAIVEKGKDLVKYLGGVVQTGDLSYKLPELIGSIIPDTKIVLNRLESQSGRREANNVVALLRRNAPTDMLRPSYAGGAGVNVTPYAPIIQRMENAAVRGDDSDFQTAYSEAVQRARSDGKPNPEGYVAQLFGARSAFNRALSGKMTQDQYDTFVSKLSPSDQANVAQYQQRFQAYASSIGSPASFVKESPSSSGSRTSRTTGRTAGVRGFGRTRRLGRTRVGRGRSRIRIGTRARRRGFRSRTRRF